MSLYHKIKRKLYPIGQPSPNYIPQFRLEGRCRDANDETALAMRIADPLWMLGRQWQFGEFQGEDNGSPISINAKYRKEQTQFYSFPDDDFRQPIGAVPPEARVEAIDVIPNDLHAKVRIGQKLETLIEKNFSRSKSRQLIRSLRTEFPLSAENQLDDKSRRFFNIMAGNVIDGGKLWEQIKEDEFPYGNYMELTAVTQQLTKWYEALYLPSPSNKAWQSKQLLHQFELHIKESPEEEDVTLTAPDYQSGHLDWYSFDKATSSIDKSTDTQEVDKLMPVNVSFASMPDKRLFSFEDSKMDITEMELEEDDLIRLMIIDFSLVSGSDWYTIPIKMKPGELCWINYIDVKDVFGVTTRINNDKNTGQFLSNNELNTWDVFKIRDKGTNEFNPADNFLYLAPATTFRIESNPLEELLFVRDEYANMVWGIEKIVRNELGKPTNGYELHLELHDPLFSPIQEEPQENALPRFRLASPVAPNWIPYLPLHLNNSHTDIQLKRAIMMRNEANETPKDILPLSVLAQKDILTIQEEAIPKAGIRIQVTNQRVRWLDGKTYIWQGRKVLTGKGEGNSGLIFDQLHP